MGTRYRLQLIGLLALAGAPCLQAETAPADPATDTPTLRVAAKGHTGRVSSGLFAPDGKRFFSAGNDRTIRAWNVADGTEIFTLKGHATSINALALSGDNLLISGAEDGAIILWDIARRSEIARLPKHSQAVQCLAVSSDGKWLASGGGTWNKPPPGELHLWDLDKRAEIVNLTGHRKLVHGVAFAPDGHALVAVDGAGEIKVWDVATHKAVTLLHEKLPWSIQFSPDGKRMAVGDMWGHIWLYNPKTWSEDGVVRAPRGTIFRLAYSPRGNMLASAGYEGAIRLWNPAQFEDQPPLRIEVGKGVAWMAAFSSDGKTLAGAGDDGLIRFWDITPAVEKRFQLPAAASPLAPAAVTRTGPVKVALIASPDAEVARNVQDLTLAKLADEQGVEMLERAAIERVLKEQKLSLSGLVDANTAVKTGQLLAVDLLAVIEFSSAIEGNSGVSVFDAATGARLNDTGFGTANLEPQALQVAASVRSAVAKWRAGTKNLTTICMMPVRNADLPRGMDPFCETLAGLLERELLAGNAMAVLERKRLEFINKEKTLVEEAGNRALLASLTILEMDVGRATQGNGIRATVTLRDNAGKELRRITREVADPNGANLLPPLAREIQEALKTTPADTLVSRNRESRRFLRDAQLLWKHKHYLQGLQAADAAFALNSSDEARVLLTEYLLYSAAELLQPGHMRSVGWGTAEYKIAPDKLREALVHAGRGLQLMDTARAALKDKNDAWEFSNKVASFEALAAQRSFFNKVTYVKIEPANAEAQADFDEFRLLRLRRIVNDCRALPPNAARDPASLGRYTKTIMDALENIGRLAPSPLAYTTALSDLANDWLEMSKSFKPEAIPLDAAASFGGFLDNVEQAHLLPTKPGPDCREMTLSVLEKASQHPHPIVRLYGAHWHRRLMFKAGKLSREEAIERHRAMLAEGQRLIDRPPFGPADPFRAKMYHLLGNAIGSSYLHTKGADVIQEYFDLCDFMLAHGDVVEDVINSAVTYGSPLRDINLRALQIIDKAVQLTDSPDRRLFDGFPDRFKNHHMKPARHKILTQLPDLLKLALPWDSVKPLVSNSELKATLLLRADVHDKHIYLFAGGEDAATKNRLLQLVRIPLEGGVPKVLGKTLVAVEKPPEWSRYFVFWITPAPFVTATAIANEKLYAGTASEGILVFPLAGGDPTRIGEKEGLPAGHVVQMTIIAGTLIAALEGGYLIAYDIATGKCETLASSRRSERLSPFDNAGPFTVAALAADPERQRILFTLAYTNHNDPQRGLWEFNLKKRQFKKIQPDILGTWSPVTNGRIYLNDAGSVLAYDLATDRFSLLHGKAPAYQADLKAEGLPANFTITFPKRLLHRGYWWHEYPFSRRSLDGAQEEYYPSLHDNTWTYGFSATASLQAVSADELLIGNHYGLYLVRLKGK